MFVDVIKLKYGNIMRDQCLYQSVHNIAIPIPLQLLHVSLCAWALDMSSLDMNGSLVINISFVNSHVQFLYRLVQRGTDSIPVKRPFVDFEAGLLFC